MRYKTSNGEYDITQITKSEYAEQNIGSDDYIKETQTQIGWKITKCNDPDYCVKLWNEEHATIEDIMKYIDNKEKE